MNETQSQFGSGLVYCLGLFLEHRMDNRFDAISDKILKLGNVDYKNVSDMTVIDTSSFFNTATDHLFDFRADQAPTEELRKRCKIFKEKCLGWRISITKENAPTLEDKYWALNEAKEILMEIDMFICVDVIKGKFG